LNGLLGTIFEELIAYKNLAKEQNEAIKAMDELKKAKNEHLKASEEVTKEMENASYKAFKAYFTATVKTDANNKIHPKLTPVEAGCDISNVIPLFGDITSNGN
jgi:hypothetical protein